MEPAGARSALTPLWATLLLIIGISIGLFVTGIISAITTFLSAANVISAGTNQIFVQLALLIGTVLIVVPPFFYARSRGLSPVSLFRFNPVTSGQILFTLAIGVGATVLIDEMDRIIFPIVRAWIDPILVDMGLNSDQLFEKIAEALKIDGVLSGLLVIGSVVFAAGFCEEMVFRGMFQRSLEGSPVKAILWSSVAFAIVHMNPWGLLQIGSIALILGIVAYKTNSIVPAIIIHALNNFFAVVYLNADPQFLTWYTSGDHVSPVLLIGAIVLLSFGLYGIITTSTRKERSINDQTQSG